jgi:hypothetical protein
MGMFECQVIAQVAAKTPKMLITQWFDPNIDLSFNKLKQRNSVSNIPAPAITHPNQDSK